MGLRILRRDDSELDSSGLHDDAGETTRDARRSLDHQLDTETAPHQPSKDTELILRKISKTRLTLCPWFVSFSDFCFGELFGPE